MLTKMSKLYWKT